MNTVFLLMAQYNAQAVLPVEVVVKDYFPHLSPANFLRKVLMGEINIPVIRIEKNSQKTAKGVHLQDLAIYLDVRREAAIKEANQLNCRR
uniref:Pyocin activator protein PrtN n=1 Tax=Curvibacter symbiont subsp. Hydra magnipapillata TaxID=667019 RepID=C9YAK7_CURXX|nr:hypothetical protein Csp_A11580 [Curvibacter putative symbiont of Hydra magnipapillata]